MYLVGHAVVAFLLAYGISKRFKVGEVSFALVMLIACLPDIDILFQSAGILPHKSYTHSLILSLIVVPSVIFAIAKWRKASAGAAFVYSLAYIQHIAIGDLVIGGTNILYPFGNMMVGTGMGYGTLAHHILEFSLLGVVAAVILSKPFSKGKQSDGIVSLFRYTWTDKLSYILLIGSITISFAYLLYGIEILPRLFIKTDLELATFILLHISAIVSMSFIIFVARQDLAFKKNAIQ